MASKGNRPARVGEAIREALATRLMRGLKTPGVGFCTVTGVDLTKDLRDAKVYVSVYGTPQEQQSTLEALSKAAPYLRGEVGREVRMKFAPSLFFILDHSVERGARVDAAIKSALDSDGELARLRGDPPRVTLPSTPAKSGLETQHGEKPLGAAREPGRDPRP